MAIRRSLLTLVGVALLVGATACGGGGGDDEEQGSASASGVADDSEDSGTDAATGTGETLPTAEDEAAGADGSGTPPAEGGAGDGGGGGSGEVGSVATELGVDRTFTGEGSEELCDEMADIQGSATPDLGNSALADQMAAITPPSEIATEWELMHTVLKTIASDPSGATLRDMTNEESDAWATANSVVAAYLGDVCGLR